MAAYRGGSDAAALIYPEPAPRSRDHHKENLRQIRSKQRNNRAQAMEKEREERRRLLRAAHDERAGAPPQMTVPL